MHTIGDVDKLAEPIAAVDIGSKNLKLVVGMADKGRLRTRLLHKEKLQLGQDLLRNKGSLGSGRIAAVVAAVRSAKSLAQGSGCKTFLAVATRAVHLAENREHLKQRLQQDGVSLEIADARREAELDYLAATQGKQGYLVSDFGSRSLQLAAKTGDRIQSQQVPLGYADAFEKYFKGRSGFSEAAHEFQEFLQCSVEISRIHAPRYLAMACKSLGAFVTGQPKDQLAGCFLSRAQIEETVNRLHCLDNLGWAAELRRTDKAEKVFPGLILTDYLTRSMSYDGFHLVEAELPVGLVVEYFQLQGKKLIPVVDNL